MCTQTNAEKDKPPCNPQELEDCDVCPEDSFSLMRFDADTLKPSHVVRLRLHVLACIQKHTGLSGLLIFGGTIIFFFL